MINTNDRKHPFILHKKRLSFSCNIKVYALYSKQIKQKVKKKQLEIRALKKANTTKCICLLLVL